MKKPVDSDNWEISYFFIHLHLGIHGLGWKQHSTPKDNNELSAIKNNYK